MTIITEAKESHHSFIVSTWIQSFWNLYLKKKNSISKEDYYARQHEKIKKVLERSKVLIIADLEEPDFFYGYLVYETNPDIAHFAYVRPNFRKQHHFSNLLHTAFPNDQRVYYTHKTPPFNGISKHENGHMKDQFINFIYEPHLF